MNSRLRTPLIVLAAILIAIASLAYGAATAPRKAIKQTPQVSQTPAPVKKTLEQRLAEELPVITTTLTNAYPKIATDYTVSKGKLYGDGQWYGAILSYHGGDTENRDTLRVLMQKKGDTWIIRSKPPQPILSAAKFPDVPVSILKAINQPVSLP